MSTTYNLTGGGPWGFRLVGGHDFRMDLSVSRVTPGGKAERAGIKAGMVLSEINGRSTKGMTHLEAQNQVKTAGSVLKLVLGEASQKRSDDVDHVSSVSSTPSSNYQSSAMPSNYQNSTATKPVSTYNPTPSYQKPASKPAPSNFVSPAPPPADDILPPPPASMLTPELKQSSNQSDPICEGCGKIIMGPYLSHKGKNWHVDEFVCAASNCRKPLQNIGFIEEKGQRYCKNCYEKHFAHTCGMCHQKIVGEVMHALNQTWHMTCFVCSQCRNPFTDGVFQMQDSKPYCINDYNQLFGQSCKACSFPIEAGDRYLEALSAQWHETCFNCAVCHIDLKNAGFFAAGGKPVCSNHKNARVM